MKKKVKDNSEVLYLEEGMKMTSLRGKGYKWGSGGSELLGTHSPHKLPAPLTSAQVDIPELTSVQDSMCPTGKQLEDSPRCCP